MLGTNPYPFDRLLLAVDQWASSSGERVVAQVGHTATPVQCITCYEFIPHEKICELITDAEIVITQGGFGSLRDCLVAEKPTIAVPRLPEQGECQDQQTEIVDALAAEGRVIALYDTRELAHAIKKARNAHNILPYNSMIPEIVAEAVESLLTAG